jgi:hypothetical protein
MIHFCRGNLIRVQGKIRTGELDFIESIRLSLENYYKPQGKTVGLGGIFQILQGSIKAHIMPSFAPVSISRLIMNTKLILIFFFKDRNEP